MTESLGEPAALHVNLLIQKKTADDDDDDSISRIK